MKKISVKAAVLTPLLTVLSGCSTLSSCVTTEQLAEVGAVAENAQSTASSAATTASSAVATANQASRTADAALEAAGDAAAAADAAMACCNENSRKLDRMFEKAMQK